MTKSDEKKTEEKKKGLFGKIFEKKQEAGSSCCNVELEEIPEDEEQDPKEKDNR
jgi:hypothetical protein